MKHRILLVDDHEMFRKGLRALLERDPAMDVIGEAQDGRSATLLVQTLSPDVVIMDLHMPDLNGIEAARQVLAARPTVKVIGVSGRSDKGPILEMFRVGASGYVLKHSAFEELVNAISTVMKDNIYVSPQIAGVIGDSDVEAGDGSGSADSAFQILSAREREVLQLLSEGKATKEVAGILKVSVKTAETHRRNLMEKLHVDSVAQLTKYAIREGLTEL